jgi:hypothetical protein
MQQNAGSRLVPARPVDLLNMHGHQASKSESLQFTCTSHVRIFITSQLDTSGLMRKRLPVATSNVSLGLLSLLLAEPGWAQQMRPSSITETTAARKHAMHD